MQSIEVEVFMRLKELRKESGKTQKELASYLGMTQAGYQKYENMKTEPNINNLIKLADLYNVSVDFILERDEASIDTLTSAQSYVKTYLKLNELNKVRVEGYALGLLAGQE